MTLFGNGFGSTRRAGGGCATVAHPHGEAAGTSPHPTVPPRPSCPAANPSGSETGLGRGAISPLRNNPSSTPKIRAGVFLLPPLPPCLGARGAAFDRYLQISLFFFRRETETSLLQETHSCSKLLVKSIKRTPHHHCDSFFEK